jgi:hypothetical protein
LLQERFWGAQLIQSDTEGAMNKFILVVLLIITSNSASAEWRVVGKTDMTFHYYDPMTLRKNGNKAKMWDLTDYIVAKKESGKEYKSVKMQSEYDCVEYQHRPIYAVTYSENMGDGQIIANLDGDKNWKPPVPGSVIEALLKIACGKK